MDGWPNLTIKDEQNVYFGGETEMHFGSADIKVFIKSKEKECD